MIELQESVKKYGILNPLIVRPRKDGTYEIISGHRRKFAAEKIGYRKVPVIIRVLKDDDAVVSMVDSNLQREMIICLQDEVRSNQTKSWEKEMWSGGPQFRQEKH